MSWRDQIQTASWRGVEFEVLDTTDTFGRRVVVDEYPLRDEPGTQDIGRRARRFSVSGVVLGSDYFAVRDRLVQALESEGIGVLIHPYFGRIEARVETCTVRQSSSRAGMAEFSASFVEAGTQTQFPVVAVDHTAASNDAGTDATGKAATATAYAMAALSGRPSWTGLAITAAVQSELTSVEELAGLEAGSTLAGAADAFASVDEVGPLLAIASIPRPESLTVAPTVTDLLVASATEAQLSEYRISALSRAAAIYTSGVFVFQTQRDALDARDRFSAATDAEMAVASAELYGALQTLRLAVVSALTEIAQALPTTSEVTIGAMTPAFVLAADYYNDPVRAAEILWRNPGMHPGAVIGTIEVLSG